MKTTRPHRKAFTLIELLVVVAIIALLISIILPAFNKARTQARSTQCLSRLKAIFVASTLYVDDQQRFPRLNNDPDEGSWQYNYLIYDGRDFEHCFGPLARPNGIMEGVEQLYCPLQTDPFHMLSTDVNPWPARRNMDTRAGYGRRYHLTGKSLSQFRRHVAYAADLIHLPQVVRTAHKNGVNVVYTDGHAQWVRDPGILTHNDLAKPFDPMDNPIVKKIWNMLDDAGR